MDADVTRKGDTYEVVSHDGHTIRVTLDGVDFSDLPDGARQLSRDELDHLGGLARQLAHELHALELSDVRQMLSYPVSFHAERLTLVGVGTFPNGQGEAYWLRWQDKETGEAYTIRNWGDAKAMDASVRARVYEGPA